jgi:hypothetical protein
MSTDALLPLRDVRTHLRVLGEHYAGLQEIPLERIVGSVNRSVDFDRFRTHSIGTASFDDSEGRTEPHNGECPERDRLGHDPAWKVR